MRGGRTRARRTVRNVTTVDGPDEIVPAPPARNRASRVSQEHLQLVIGRLVTDPLFRRRLEQGGSAYLSSLRFQGEALTRGEIAALIAIDPRVWTRVAAQIDLALKSDRLTSPAGGRPSSESTLTRQQQRVLAAICEGFGNRDIAACLGISEGAVKATVQQLFRRFAVRRRVQLVRLVLSTPAMVPGSTATRPPADSQRQRAAVPA